MTKDREAPVKGYELDEINSKLDNFIEDFREFKNVIKDQNDKYVTQEKLALEINPINTSLKTYNRVIWLIASALVPVVALTFWQFLVNNSKTSHAVESSNVQPR